MSQLPIWKNGDKNTNLTQRDTVRMSSLEPIKCFLEERKGCGVWFSLHALVALVPPSWSSQACCTESRFVGWEERQHYDKHNSLPWCVFLYVSHCWPHTLLPFLKEIFSSRIRNRQKMMGHILHWFTTLTMSMRWGVSECKIWQRLYIFILWKFIMLFSTCSQPSLNEMHGPSIQIFNLLRN